MVFNITRHNNYRPQLAFLVFCLYTAFLRVVADMHQNLHRNVLVQSAHAMQYINLDDPGKFASKDNVPDMGSSQTGIHLCSSSKRTESKLAERLHVCQSRQGHDHIRPFPTKSWQFQNCTPSLTNDQDEQT